MRRCAPKEMAESGARLVTEFEVERDRVDAVADPRGRGTVGEDVAEVGVAGPAAHFDAAHPVAGVLQLADVGAVGLTEEARPAAARVVLLFGGEERRAAADAAIRAFA